MEFAVTAAKGVGHLGSLNRTVVLPQGAPPDAAFNLAARLTPLQQRAFSRLGLNPARIR